MEIGEERVGLDPRKVEIVTIKWPPTGGGGEKCELWLYLEVKRL